MPSELESPRTTPWTSSSIRSPRSFAKRARNSGRTRFWLSESFRSCSNGWRRAIPSARTVQTASAQRSSSQRWLVPRTMDRSARLALAVFVLVAAIALVLFLAFGHREWFFVDEWDFLLHRDAGDIGDLLRPHNEHWSTLPILVYRALWRMFGVRTYVPYQAVLILLHLTAAFLLRTVMRRAGVGPWTAT